MIAFIEEHRKVHGVEPICRVLQIAPATFHRHAAIARNPELASERARQDKEDFEEIRRVHDKSRGRYGARKVFAIGLERMATRWLTTSFGETSTTLRAAPWND
jgi:hypothetical protein